MWKAPSPGDLEKWIAKVRRCEHLEETELKQLCDMVKENFNGGI